MVVTVEDVAREIGRAITSPEEVAQVQGWIRMVELRISRRLGDLALLDQDALRIVIPGVVARRVRNPEGKYSERIDDYSYSLTATASRSDLTLTDEEWAILAPATAQGAFMIRTGGQPGYATPPGWW